MPFIIAGVVYLGIGVYRTSIRGNEPIWHAPFWPVGLFLK